MSTDLGNINDKSLTRFYGGDAHGVCVQITCGSGYVQLSASEIVTLIPELKSIIDYELSRKKAECDRVLLEQQELKNTIVNDMSEVAKMAIAQPVLDMSALLLLGKVVIDKTDFEGSGDE